ncbi:MAG: hypothetical protein AAF519_03430 [Bacteroidota bacterium]
MKSTDLIIYTTCLTIAVWIAACQSNTNEKTQISRVGFEVNVNVRGKEIPNIWESEIIWFWGDNFLEKADKQPDDFVAKRYPFLERFDLQLATGGEIAGYPGCSDKTRDLFIDPYDCNSGYDFSALVHACKNIVRQGVKPLIKTGAVPICMSSDPEMSPHFYTNVRPPDDYNEYFDYIQALTSALADEFGKETLASWDWGFVAEYENDHIFYVEDKSVEKSKQAVFKLYDYTVAALESVIGSGQVKMQIHPCAVCGFWDGKELIYHAYKETNYYTGDKGTPLHYVVTSHYSNWNTSPTEFAVKNKSIQDYADSLGIKDLKFGLGEEGTLFDTAQTQLLGGVTGHPAQLSLDAFKFKLALDNNIDWITRWSWSSNRVWGIIEMPVVNVAKLCHRMAGDERVAVVKNGLEQFLNNEVYAVSSFDKNENTLKVLAFNHNKDFAATGAEEVSVTVTGFDQDEVVIKKWIIDETHSNFWPTWWNEQGEIVELGPMKGEYGMKGNIPISRFDSFAFEAFKYEEDRKKFMKNLDRYRELNQLMRPEVLTTEVQDTGMLNVDFTLEHHGVVYLEISAPS